MSSIAATVSRPFTDKTTPFFHAEMDFVFDIPTREFAAYQVKHAIPYWFKRYVFFNKSARLTPLIEMRKWTSPHHA